MNARTLVMTLAATFLLPAGVFAGEVFDYDYFDMGYLQNGLSDDFAAVTDSGAVNYEIDKGNGIGVRGSLALNSRVHVFAGYSDSSLDLKATQRVPYPSLDDMQAAFFTTPAVEAWDTMCDLNGDNEINFLDLALLKEAEVNGNASMLTSQAATDGDITDVRLGVGYNRLIGPRTGFYTQLFWDARDIDFGKTMFMGANRDFGANDNGIGATVGLRAKLVDRFEMSGHVTYTPVGDVNMVAETGDFRLGDDTLIGVGGIYRVTPNLGVSLEVEGDLDGDAVGWLLGLRYGDAN